MELFTFISLLIAITGTSYTAIEAAKKQYKSKAAKNYDAGKIAYEGVSLKVGGKEKVEKTTEKHYRRLNQANFCWKYSLPIPTVVFGIISFFLAIYVLFQNDPQNPTSVCSVNILSWGSFRLILGAVLIIDVAVAAVAFFAYRGIKNRVSQLSSALNIAAKAAEKATLLELQNESSHAETQAPVPSE